MNAWSALGHGDWLLPSLWAVLNLIMLAGGALFGFGLAYSGMNSPEVVLSFLNVKAFDVRKPVTDNRLLAGAAVFGIGWGVAGMCPGPAIAGLGAGNFKL